MTDYKFIFSSCAKSHPGFSRDNNEDAFSIFPDRNLYILADGMGGHQAGEVASRMAVDTASNFINGQELKSPTELHGEILMGAIYAAHQSIQEMASSDFNLTSMGTTLVLAWIPPPGNTLWLSHVGDSRAYLFHQGNLRRLSEDHTYLNQIRKAGKLPEDPHNWPPRNILSQAVGSSLVISPDVLNLELHPGDRILLASDGLHDVLSDMQISQILSEPKLPHKLCDDLINSALQNSAEDNVTVIVVQVEI